MADKVLSVIRKIRQRIENAIVKFWNFVKGKAKKLLGKIGFGGTKEAIKDSKAKEIENDPNKARKKGETYGKKVNEKKRKKILEK